jgi:hypothetical protein
MDVHVPNSLPSADTTICSFLFSSEDIDRTQIPRKSLAVSLLGDEESSLKV